MDPVPGLSNNNILDDAELLKILEYDSDLEPDFDDVGDLGCDERTFLDFELENNGIEDDMNYDEIEEQMKQIFEEVPGSLDEMAAIIERDCNDDNTVKQFPFTKKCEFLGHDLLSGYEPIDYFNLYFSKEFIDMIVRESNEYAERLFLSAGVKEHSRITHWKPLTTDEFRVLLGLLLHTGNIKAARLTDYWKRAPLYTLGYGAYMSRNRFMLIMRCMHFSRNPDSEDDLPDDRLFKIRPVLEHFNDRNKILYYPQRNVCIDESVMLWRGRLFFRVYIKNKRHKYGLKFYLLTEPNGFILRTILYSGKSDSHGGVGHAEKIVMSRMKDFVNSGHSVFMDNYYNSVGLAQKLIDHKTNCTGTLRKDRKDNHIEVINKNLKKGECFQVFPSKNICVGKWKDKRDVFMISTEATMHKIRVMTKRQTTVEKPTAVALYNKFMSGINLQDQLQAYYSCEK